MGYVGTLVSPFLYLINKVEDLMFIGFHRVSN